MHSVIHVTLSPKKREAYIKIGKTIKINSTFVFERLFNIFICEAYVTKLRLQSRTTLKKQHIFI